MGEWVRGVVVRRRRCRVEWLTFLMFALRATTKPNTTAARLRRLKQRVDTFA